MASDNENKTPSLEALVDGFSSEPSLKRRRSVTPNIFWATLGVLITFTVTSGLALAGSYIYHAEKSSEYLVAKASSDEQAAKAVAARGAARLVQVAQQKLATEAKNFTDRGYASAGNGLYFRFANAGEYTCGHWDCAAVFLATGEASCSGAYVEANIMQGTMAIGIANDTVGALGPWSSASVILEDYVGGDSFKITKVNCW